MNIQRILPTLGPESPDRTQSDPLQIIATFRRRLKVFSATVAFVLAAVFIYTLEQTPRFTATSYVMIDTRKRDVSKIDEVVQAFQRQLIDITDIHHVALVEVRACPVLGDVVGVNEHFAGTVR